MVQATIAQIKERIEESDSIEQQSKKELIDLLVSLQAEIDRLSSVDSDHAKSIAGFAQTSTHEALRKEKKPDLYKLSLEGLQASVHGFENSHPKLVEIVNSICVSLSNLGI
jgi:queuine/archaeosine tRNA-ribosyltransferase